MKRGRIELEQPAWPAHLDDGVWYCDKHGTYACRECANGKRCLDCGTMVAWGASCPTCDLGRDY